jgi:hypothetical protein
MHKSDALFCACDLTFFQNIEHHLYRVITAMSPASTNSRLEVDIMMNSLDLLVLFQPVRPQFPSNTTLLEPTEWNTIMSHHVMITPYCSRIYCGSDPQCLGVVLGEYSCA